jgi:Trk-type K+ transport system membrane component
MHEHYRQATESPACRNNTKELQLRKKKRIRRIVRFVVIFAVTIFVIVVALVFAVWATGRESIWDLITYIKDNIHRLPL